MSIGCLAAGAVAGVATGSGVASAVPPGLEKKPPEVFVCNGEEVVVHGGQGRSAWVGGELHLAVEFHVTGTFTPTDGAPQPFEFHKEFGGGPPGDTVECSGHFEDTDETGTFVADVEVVAVRVPDH